MHIAYVDGWRNNSASDSRPEGCGFDSQWRGVLVCEYFLVSFTRSAEAHFFQKISVSGLCLLQQIRGNRLYNFQQKSEATCTAKTLHQWSRHSWIAVKDVYVERLSCDITRSHALRYQSLRWSWLIKNRYGARLLCGRLAQWQRIGFQTRRLWVRYPHCPLFIYCYCFTQNSSQIVRSRFGLVYLWPETISTASIYVERDGINSWRNLLGWNIGCWTPDPSHTHGPEELGYHTLCNEVWKMWKMWKGPPLKPHPRGRWAMHLEATRPTWNFAENVPFQNRHAYQRKCSISKPARIPTKMFHFKNSRMLSTRIEQWWNNDNYHDTVEESAIACPRVGTNRSVNNVGTRN